MSEDTTTATVTAIRARLARCAALGYGPGPVNGIAGPRTRGSFEAATAAQRARGLPFQHPCGIVLSIASTGLGAGMRRTLPTCAPMTVRSRMADRWSGQRSPAPRAAIR